MEILHTISDLSIENGGPTTCTYNLVRGLNSLFVKTNILSFESKDGDTIVGKDPFIYTLPHTLDFKLFATSKITRFLKYKNSCIYHINGLWEPISRSTIKYAKRHKIPYIVCPHGMLYPQAIHSGSTMKKKIYLWLTLINDLNKAAAIHATCEQEMKHLRALGIKSPIAIIPNPIETPPVSTTPSNQTRLRIGYLGRIHPRKKVELLLYVWDKLRVETADADLVIMGDGDESYVDFLKHEQERLKLNNVIFTGFITGSAKEDMLRTISYLVVPSDFENFGMIVPEALVMGIPVIASKGTPWQELDTHQCGWWINNDLETLTATVKKALGTSNENRQIMGENGKKLILKNYSIEVVAEKVSMLYNWIVTKEKKPEFVYTE